MNRGAPWALALALGAASCAGTGGGLRRNAAGRPSVIEFRASGTPARAYNDPPLEPAPENPLVTEVSRALATAATSIGIAAPTVDGRLCRVAGDVAGLVAGDRPPPYAAIEFALGQHGILEPSPSLLVVHLDKDEEAAIAEALAGVLPAALARGRFARAGVGVVPLAGGRATVVLALQESGLYTAPIPRQVAHAAEVALRGRVLAPYGEPEVYVAGADGAVTREKLVLGADGEFRARVRCGPRDGRYQVEVIGHDVRGAAVLANFPIWCGEAVPAFVRVARPGPDEPIVRDPVRAAEAIFALANEDRHRAGLAPLVWDGRAATAAAAHSEEMRDLAYVGHVSPKTGAAADRARRAGIRTPLVLENLARAYSPAEAQAGLMNSPGHRANLLSPEATHLGVGVALGREVGGYPELYVTQLFFRVPPPLDVAEALAAVRGAIQARRAASGVRPLAWEAALARIAQEQADALALDEANRDGATARAERALARLSDRFAAVLTVTAVVMEPSQAVGDAASDGSFSHVGVGVSQGRHPTMGDGATFVVIVLAQGR